MRWQQTRLTKKTHTEFNDERATFEETVSVSPRLNGVLAHHTNILPPPGEIQVTQTISTNLNASNLKVRHDIGHWILVG